MLYKNHGIEKSRRKLYGKAHDGKGNTGIKVQKNMKIHVHNSFIS